jgi:hypothetical protein
MSEYRKDMLALVVATVLVMLVSLRINSDAVFGSEPARAAIQGLGHALPRAVMG